MTKQSSSNPKTTTSSQFQVKDILLISYLIRIYSVTDNLCTALGYNPEVAVFSFSFIASSLIDQYMSFGGWRERQKGEVSLQIKNLNSRLQT